MFDEHHQQQQQQEPRWWAGDKYDKPSIFYHEWIQVVFSRSLNWCSWMIEHYKLLVRFFSSSENGRKKCYVGNGYFVRKMFYTIRLMFKSSNNGSWIFCKLSSRDDKKSANIHCLLINFLIIQNTMNFSSLVSIVFRIDATIKYSWKALLRNYVILITFSLLSLAPHQGLLLWEGRIVKRNYEEELWRGIMKRRMWGRKVLRRNFLLNWGRNKK